MVRQKTRLDPVVFLSLMKENNGRFSMIVPTAILAQDSYKDLRREILSRSSLVSLTRLPNESFGSAAGEVKVDTVIVTWKTPIKSDSKFEIIAYRGYERISKIEKDTAYISGEKKVSTILNDPDIIWSVGTTDVQIELLNKIESSGHPLSGYVEFCLGLTPYDKYRGHTVDQIKHKVFHADYKKDKTFRKLLRGNDVRRYSVSWNGESWISYGDWLGAPRDQKFFTEKRILVKQIIDWSSLRIWAALTDEELYNTQNAFNLIGKGSLDLSYILGLLNSKLINFYHSKKFLDEFKMRFQKILIKDCKRFPIHGVDFDDHDELEKYKNIIDHVTNIQNLFNSRRTEKNPETLRRLDDRIKMSEHQIDCIVYDLYGLTQDEIKIIDVSVV